MPGLIKKEAVEMRTIAMVYGVWGRGQGVGDRCKEVDVCMRLRGVCVSVVGGLEVGGVYERGKILCWYLQHLLLWQLE